MVSSKPACPAPALERGIRILQLLEDGEPASLESIAERLEAPKSSAGRLLETLESLGVVTRDPETRRFVSHYRLAPRLAPKEALRERAIARELESLAHATARTAEWYAPGEAGLVLVQRREPPGLEVAPNAKVGFLRSWEGELEAVCALGNAFFRPEEPPRRGAFWCYRKHGVRGELSVREARERIRRAAEGEAVADAAFNTNGARRCAALVRFDERPAGVLALAETFRFDRPGDPETWLDPLVQAARRLARL